VVKRLTSACSRRARKLRAADAPVGRYEKGQMSKKALFSRYLKELSAVALQGDAREESFYPALADMLAEVAQTSGRTHVRVTTPRCRS